MNRLTPKLLLAVAVILALGGTHSIAEDEMSVQDIKGQVANARQEVQISTTYMLSPYLRASGLSVTAMDGKVTLTGNVEEAAHKELAAAIAEGVSGVKDIDNQIIVDADYKKPERGTARGYGDMVDDATITTTIKSKLLWNKHTEGMDTKVVTKDGKVELSGTVTTQQASQQAEKLASNTDGVSSVNNQLKVDGKAKGVSADGEEVTETGTMMADSWITTKVKSTFMYSSNVSGSDISVNTDKGIVTLIGKVDSGVEQALAIELAQNIRGVKSVSSEQLIH